MAKLDDDRKDNEEVASTNFTLYETPSGTTGCRILANGAEVDAATAESEARMKTRHDGLFGEAASHRESTMNTDA